MSTKTEKRKTSAELKADIEAKTQEMKEKVKDGSLPLTPGVVAEINASESTPEPTLKTESKPQEATPPAEPVTGHEGGSVDYKEWAKKKGIDWTTDSNVLAALHKSDQEFHKRRAEEKSKEAAQPPPQPPPYVPPAYNYPPTYASPPNSLAEGIARQYNMTVEDVQRLAAFNKDFFEVAMRQERERQNKELEEFKIENQKNSVFRELSSDPVFRNPAVAIEFHNVLDQMQASDPVSFEKDPLQYRRAYDKALSNIGRRNLEGKPIIENGSQVNIPSTPPKPLGQGSGGGYQEGESAIDMKSWNNLSSEEKKKWFQERGLVSGY